MKTYAYSAAWMLLEKIAKAASAFIITALIARELGPHDFGIFSIAISLVTILWSVSSLGLDGVLIKEFSQEKYSQQELFSTIYICRLALSLIITLLGFLILASKIASRFSTVELTVAAICLSALPFYNYNTYFSYYQATSNSKLATIVSLIATAICFLIKLFILYFYPSIHMFAAAFLADAAILLISFKIINNDKSIKIRVKHFNIEIVKYLSKPALPLALSSLLVIAYGKLDHFMIAEILGVTHVGIYSVAARIAEAYLIIPTLIATSFYPMLAKNFTDSSSGTYFDIVYFSSLTIAIILLLISPICIPFLFGNEYIDSIYPLQILILGSLFSILGSVATNYFILKDMPYVRLIRAAIGLFINMVLNMYFIPKWGVIGAAYATLVSQVFACWVSNCLSKKTISCFKLQTLTLLTGGIRGVSRITNGLRNDRN